MIESRKILAKYSCIKTPIIGAAHSFGNYLYLGTGPNGIVYRSDFGCGLSDFYSTGENYVTSIIDFGGALFIGTSPNGKIFMHNFNTGNRFHVVTTGDYKVSSFCVHDNKLYAGTSPSGILFSFDGDKWLLEYDSYGMGIKNVISYKNNLYLFVENGNEILCFSSGKWGFVKSGENIFSISSFKKVTTSIDILQKNSNYDFGFGASNVVNDKIYFSSGNRCSLYSFDGNNVLLVNQWSGEKIGAIEASGNKQIAVAVDDTIYVCDLE